MASVTSQVDPLLPGEEAHRQATRINDALAKVGWASPTAWWNDTAYDELSGRTPLQAWLCGEYGSVMRLAQRQISARFADTLSRHPEVVQELTAQ